MVVNRRNLQQRAAAVSRVVTTIAARTNAEISEQALAEATLLPDSAVRRILRRLALHTLVRWVGSNRWAVAPFVTRGYQVVACPSDF